MKRIDYPGIGETLYAAELPNGLSVLVVTKPGYKRRFAEFAANYGGADRRFSLGGQTIDTPAGVAHYLEHKMFDMPAGDALMTMTAAGASPNAFTSHAMTAYHFECTERFEENLRTLLSFVSTPYFTQASVDKERGIIEQEILMYEDNPDFVVYDRMMRRLYRHSPLRDNVAGTVGSIAEITPEVLYDCHKVFYHPSNMALSVVGDVDPEAVERIAREVLTPERAELPVRDYGPEEDLLPTEPLCEKHMEVAQPLFILGAKLGPDLKGEAGMHERLVASLAMRCLCGHSSPFYIRRYSEGLLNASFGAGTDYAAGQAMAVFEGDTPKDPREVRDALFEEIARVGRDGFDPQLFERQKKAALGSRLRGLGNFRSLCTTMVDCMFNDFEPLGSFRRLPGITMEEAAAWVRDRLVPERFTMSCIYPKEG